jgi:hypothetical protein
MSCYIGLRHIKGAFPTGMIKPNTAAVLHGAAICMPALPPLLLLLPAPVLLSLDVPAASFTIHHPQAATVALCSQCCCFCCHTTQPRVLLCLHTADYGAAVAAAAPVLHRQAAPTAQDQAHQPTAPTATAAAAQSLPNADTAVTAAAVAAANTNHEAVAAAQLGHHHQLQPTQLLLPVLCTLWHDWQMLLLLLLLLIPAPWNRRRSLGTITQLLLPKLCTLLHHEQTLLLPLPLVLLVLMCWLLIAITNTSCTRSIPWDPSPSCAQCHQCWEASLRCMPASGIL